MTTDRVATEAEPYQHFDAEVTAVSQLSPSMVRVSFGGVGLNGMAPGRHDQRIKIFLPPHGERTAEVPRGADWYARLREIPEERRPVMRTYTIRSGRRGEIDVDFVRHGDTGPASRWAGIAQPGDQVVIYGPNAQHESPPGADYAPARDASWQLIAGDETALPAIGRIVESLPAGTRARVFVAVPEREDIQRWRTEGDVETVWLPRNGTSRGGSGLLLNAVRDARLPDGAPYVWLAGEAGSVRDLRRHLINERSVERGRIQFCGYWRRGKTEDAPYDGDDQQD